MDRVVVLVVVLEMEIVVAVKAEGIFELIMYKSAMAFQ